MNNVPVKKISLFPIYMVAFIDMLGFGVIIPVLRDFTRFLADASNYQSIEHATLSGILMASYSLAQFIFAPILGRLSDRFGRKKLLFLSVAGNVLSYAIWAISNSYGLFLISRLISGMTGGNISVAQSYLADVTSEEDRGKAMGMIGALFGIGFILGPFIGGILSSVDITKWSSSMITFNQFSAIGIFCASLSIANLVLIVFLLQESLQHPKKESSKHNGLKSIMNAARGGSSVIGRLYLIHILISITFVSLEVTLAWDLLYRFKLDTKETGYFFAYMGVMMAIVQGGIYRILYRKIQGSLLLQIGLIATLVSFGLYRSFNELVFFCLVIALLSFGLGILNSSLLTLVSLFSKKEDHGINLGIMQSLSALTRAFIPLVTTLIYDYIHPGIISLLSFCYILIALVVSFRFQKPKTMRPV